MSLTKKAFEADNTWNRYLAEIDRTANQQMETIMEGMLKTHPAPDKESDLLGWTQRMNNIEVMAEEFVLQELVYV